METIKIIADIKMTCANLEKEKKELVAKVTAIDDRLTAYRMAIDSLELTIPAKKEPEAKPAVRTMPSNTKYNPGTVVEFNGERKKLSQWSKDLGMSAFAVAYRLNSGWTIADALTKPKTLGGQKTGHKRTQKVFMYDDHDNVLRQYVSVVAASKDLRLPEATIRSNIINVTKQDQLSSRGYYLAYAE